MKPPSTDHSDLAIYLALGVGLTLGAVMLLVVQADHPSLPLGAAVQLSLSGGLLLSTTGLLVVGLLHWVRPSPLARRPSPAGRSRPSPVDGGSASATDDLPAAA